LIHQIDFVLYLRALLDSICLLHISNEVTKRILVTISDAEIKLAWSQVATLSFRAAIYRTGPGEDTSLALEFPAGKHKCNKQESR
jgi:hypothetical protein